MALEGPIITTIIGQLPDQKLNLAGFGIAFVLALVIEAPVMPLLSSVPALCHDLPSFRRLRGFMWGLAAATTLFMLAVTQKPIFNFITERVFSVPPEVRGLAHMAILVLLPWPAAIGYRRFYQGLMIRFGMPGRVAFGTIARLLCMAACGLLLCAYSSLPSACIGAAALSAGVCGEALLARIMAEPALRRIAARSNLEVPELELTWRRLAAFYFPLTLTVLLDVGLQPLVTLFVSHARYPLESLAVLPVTNSLTFSLVACLIAVQETCIVLSGDRRAHLQELARFAVSIGLIMSGVLALFAFTPLGEFALTRIWGLKSDLLGFGLVVLQLSLVIPLLRALESLQRGLLVKERNTMGVSIGALIEIGVACAGLAVLTTALGWIGAFAAPLALTCGSMLAMTYLAVCIRRSAVHCS